MSSKLLVSFPAAPAKLRSNSRLSVALSPRGDVMALGMDDLNNHGGSVAVYAKKVGVGDSSTQRNSGDHTFSFPEFLDTSGFVDRSGGALVRSSGKFNEL